MTVPPGKGVTATTAPGHCTIRHVSLGPHVSSVFYLSITLCFGLCSQAVARRTREFRTKGWVLGPDSDATLCPFSARGRDRPMEPAR